MDFNHQPHITLFAEMNPPLHSHLFENPRPSGFSLIELLTALAIVAITLGIAAPSFRFFINNARMVSETNQFVEALNIARSKAISTHWFTIVAPINAGNWSGGFQVFLDANNNQSLDDGEVVLQTYPPITQPITITSTYANRITYTPYGTAVAGSLYICSDPDVAQYRRITIAGTGRIRTVDQDAPGEAYGTNCPGN